MISRTRSFTTRLPAFLIILALPVLHVAAQRPTPPQRGGTPRSDTPQLVVGVLTSRDRGVGAEAADAIRRRMQSEHTATELYLVPRPAIEATLRASGYDPDSPLAAGDLMTLTKSVRGDYALDGTVERTSAGVQTSLRLLTQTGSVIVSEPVATIVGADVGDIAKKVDRAVSETIRALGFYRDCMNAMRLADYPKAMAAAQQGLRLRPTSAALNVCVLSLLAKTGATPDSIIAVASVITSVDSSSTIAWANLAGAYDRKGDSVTALAATRTLHRLDPSNTDVTISLVNRLVGAGQVDSALAVLDPAILAAPANAELLRRRWLAQLRLGRFADALMSGAALVAADSSAATSDYYERQVGAARGVRDSALVLRLAREASARFPRTVNFVLILARDAVDRGAPREAIGLVDRALSIEPANIVAWQLAITAQARANGTDSSLATARRALAAGATAEAVGASLLAVVTPALAAAQTSQARADWQAVLRTAQAVDSVAPSPRSAFYVGFSAYQVAAADIQSLAELTKRPLASRTERQAACTSAGSIEGLIRVVTIAMPKGGSVDPTNAGRILGALPGLTEFLTSVKKTSCR